MCWDRDALHVNSAVSYGNAQDTSKLSQNTINFCVGPIHRGSSFLFYSSLSEVSGCARLGYKLWDTEHLPSDCFDLEDE